MAKRSVDNGDRKRDNRGYLESDSAGFNGGLLVYPGFFSSKGLGGGLKMAEETKKKMSVEDIATLVRNSGFKTNESEKKTVENFLQRLADFMQIEKKNGDSEEAMIRKLVNEGILSQAEAEKALKKVNGKKKGNGGIKYEESQRASINFSRTSVNHVLRLVRGL